MLCKNPVLLRHCLGRNPVQEVIHRLCSLLHTLILKVVAEKRVIYRC